MAVPVASLRARLCGLGLALATRIRVRPGREPLYLYSGDQFAVRGNHIDAVLFRRRVRLGDDTPAIAYEGADERGLNPCLGVPGLVSPCSGLDLGQGGHHRPHGFGWCSVTVTDLPAYLEAETAQVTATGPGGELTVDGLGVFEFAFPLDEASPEYVEQFHSQTAVAAVIPTVRAAFNDLNMRMELGAPPVGTVRYAPEPEQAGGAEVDEDSRA